jgi:hypothetical protein
MSSLFAHVEQQDPFGTMDGLVALALVGAVIIVWLYLAGRKK